MKRSGRTSTNPLTGTAWRTDHAEDLATRAAATITAAVTATSAIVQELLQAQDKPMGCAMLVGWLCGGCPSCDVPPSSLVSSFAGCDWQCYLDRYPDLQNAFGATNVAKAERHWQNHGQNDGRDCTCPAPSCKSFCMRKTEPWGVRCSWGGCGGCPSCLVATSPSASL